MVPQTVQLVMRTGPTPGKAFVLNKAETTVGRDTSNDIVINDAEISRKHARIINTAGGYLLEDLGSTNGTFVNGQRLMGPHSLRPGELVMFGENVSLVFESSSYDPSATVVSGGLGPHATVVEPSEEGIGEAPPGAQAYPPPPPQQQPQQPIFQPVTPPPPSPYGQPMEVEAPPAQPKKGGGRIWLLAGCGCLIILLCILVVAFFFYVDAGGPTRWCQFFPFLTGCR